MKYDVTVIGSGPGGYVAAIRCAQLGLKTAIIERYPVLGGTCLNVGCIPSKALLDSSEHYHNAKHKFELHGIGVTGLKVNMPQMVKRKNEVVDQTTKGIEFLMKKNKIDVFTGHGSFVSANKISIAKADGTKEEIETDKTIIATGSKPIVPEAFNYDKKRVITSTEALNIDTVPKRIVVIGGGVIGLELGSVYARLGTEVEVVEYMDRIIPTMDSDCSKELQRALKGLGFKFHLKHKVNAVKATKKGVTVEVQKRDSEETFNLEADYCLVAIGRKPYTDNLGLENAGVQKDEKGRIAVDAHLQTNVPGIYAIGDVVKGAMLAHKAEEEGVFVAETIAGQQPHVDYNLIPGVVYTWPEVAAVGQTEEQLKEAGVLYKVGKFPMKALGRARASTDTEGMVKILAHKETDEILGMHIVGARAADLIADAVTLMEFRASAEDCARMSHAHPTYAEAIKEAALAATGDRALHI
ncbi:MAG: dihydrolipoyl dehydrogenase [Saprospiraceae bacterium]|nr:dihydrolipoyl dehydrogenase [Saprospiraceae bacterium]MCF8252602.1 dihydrolipoyl dehydrogenase [Saprospiraceae bacterium]MCF8282689.1 dihydrolipoyl dehydrogenase [Bacteroidales bacterium]MCF8314192.1 dihydrolipoyl dehydrogenase [Saprospiraceae bacterium]MCF8442954.1 dihydrolipoyl dehydrogenase [Saprospiraceae bacterium]